LLAKDIGAKATATAVSARDVAMLTQDSQFNAKSGTKLYVVQRMAQIADAIATEKAEYQRILEEAQEKVGVGLVVSFSCAPHPDSFKNRDPSPLPLPPVLLSERVWTLGGFVDKLRWLGWLRLGGCVCLGFAFILTVAHTGPSDERHRDPSERGAGEQQG
jgi:hypothetical protein